MLVNATFAFDFDCFARVEPKYRIVKFVGMNAFVLVAKTCKDIVFNSFAPHGKTGQSYAIASILLWEVKDHQSIYTAQIC